MGRSNSRDPLNRTTSLETRSHSPSPTSTPTTVHNVHEYYGTANLTDRSRSPSPSTRLRLANTVKTQPHVGGRRLPATPNKPSSLFLGNLTVSQPNDNNMPHVIPSPTVPQPQKSPGSINFPHLNASPTHFPTKTVQNPAAIIGVNLTTGGSSRSLLVSPSPDRSDQSLIPQLGGPLHPGAVRPTQQRYTFVTAPLLNNGRTDPRIVVDRIDDGCTVRNHDHVNTSGALPNGFKPGQGTTVHKPSSEISPLRHRKPPTAQPTSDSDDDDWC